MPFEDIGWKTMGHFGGMQLLRRLASVYPRTACSRQAATVDVQLASGDSVPARIVDIGDRRASFFVASWPSGGWRILVARDAVGKELETFTNR